MSNVKVKIKDIAIVKNGSTPSTLNSEYYDGDIIWITPKDLSNQSTRYTYKGERTLTKTGFDSCSAVLVPKGTVLLSSRAPIGLLSIAGVELCTNQGFKNLIPIREKIDSEYLYYYLKTKISDIEKLGSGTTFKEVSKSSLEDFAILIPEGISTQQKIANILSGFDTKIELNHLINSELASIAKTLYDYWFVQFDFPNDKGKPYKSTGGKMVRNKKLNKEIPEGWPVELLGKVLKTSLGGTPSTKNSEYWENATIPWLNSGDIANFPVISSSSFITKKGVDNSATTILPKGSVVISLVRYIRPSIIAIESCANQSVVGICESVELKNTFIYPCLVNEVPRLMKLRTGAQQPHINKETIDETLVCIPCANILDQYYKISKPIYQKIINCAFETQTLTELRDWLLPMLMNGQVRVN